jgi:hypothetical protein
MADDDLEAGVAADDGFNPEASGQDGAARVSAETSEDAADDDGEE